LLLRTLLQPIWKPEPALALGVPLVVIDGTQPSEFCFAVQ
jgi:hypothetical protein